MNKTLFICYFIIVFSLISLRSSAFAEEKSITVFAAASTTGPLKQIADIYKKKTGNDIKFSFASSGTLARQIEQGARADIYISASKKWADYASSKGLLEESTKKEFLGNSLVLICPAENTAPSVQFSKEYNIATAVKGKISIGNPSHVPAGKYAKEALISLGWWEKIKSRFIMSKDVRSALRVVELGEAVLGVVYGSDACKCDKVKVVGVFPASTHKPIVYVVAKCKGGCKSSEEFIAMLCNEEASGVFKSFGFIPKSKK